MKEFTFRTDITIEEIKRIHYKYRKDEFNMPEDWISSILENKGKKIQFRREDVIYPGTMRELKNPTTIIGTTLKSKDPSCVGFWFYKDLFMEFTSKEIKLFED